MTKITAMRKSSNESSFFGQVFYQAPKRGPRLLQGWIISRRQCGKNARCVVVRKGSASAPKSTVLCAGNSIPGTLYSMIVAKQKAQWPARRQWYSVIALTTDEFILRAVPLLFLFKGAFCGILIFCQVFSNKQNNAGYYYKHVVTCKDPPNKPLL